MPKLSVYVSDDLWERAKTARPESSTSQLIQEGLLALAESVEGRPTFARERPKSLETAVHLQVIRFANQARQLYEKGYKFGVELSKKLDWASLDDLAGFRWRIDPWFEKLRRQGEEGSEDLNRLFAEFDIEGGLGTFEAGMIDALKDIWSSVRGN